jgi:2-polyprenyl-3-methyl-5-hydroxy-6-metoxy-1,4-benzoquinol methylase
MSRDYNAELKDIGDSKYAYNFDIDVMHPYMIKSFKPFFVKGNLLELGSHEGNFTAKLLPYFDDITCVEASAYAVETAREKIGSQAKIFCSTFEKVKLEGKYDNIILTHVLEHVDDPINLLRLIRNKWLSNNGCLFIVCPNAYAASRQIAVKMGIIEHVMSVTTSESAHGHKRTYYRQKLQNDILCIGFDVIYSSGIFFKPLANFQWDKLLKTDIISKEYLDGCYELGKDHPDLCSSIFLVCKKEAPTPF